MDAMQLIHAAIKHVDPSKAGLLAKVTPTTEIRALGMDSVATMEMVAWVEEHINHPFPDEVLVQVTTFGDLQKLIEKAQAK